MSSTFRSSNNHGTINEIELTPEHALDLDSGKIVACLPRGERSVADDSGHVIRGQAATAQRFHETP